MADDVLTRAGPVAVPLDYELPTGTEIIPRSVTASFNGAAAAGAFIPLLQIIAPNGTVTAYCARQTEIAAGASVLVSWFPGVAEADSSSLSGGGSGTIESIVSPAGTISVAEPTGPDTKIDLPPSGVAAGTYGDATHTAQVTIDTEGIVTAASQIGISGLAGTGMVLLFDQTLVANALTIDTGANAIPTGHGVLFIFVYARSNRAGNALDNLGVLFNNDTGANYDQQRAGAAGTTFTALGSTGSAVVLSGADIAGATAPANTFGVVELRVPSYDSTAGFKTVIAQASNPQNSTTVSQWQSWSAEWRSTAAINQVTINSATGSQLIIGSRMQIYGAQ